MFYAAEVVMLMVVIYGATAFCPANVSVDPPRRAAPRVIQVRATPAPALPRARRHMPVRRAGSTRVRSSYLCFTVASETVAGVATPQQALAEGCRENCRCRQASMDGAAVVSR